MHLGITTRRCRDLVALGVLIEVEPGKYEPTASARRYAAYRDPGGPEMRDVLDDLAVAASRLDRVQRALDPSDPDFLAKAREAAALIEEIDGLWRLSLATRPEAERAMIDNLRRLSVDTTLAGLIEGARDHVARRCLPAEEVVS